MKISQMDHNIDWDRWHDLLDIEDQRKFTLDEQVEYNRFALIVEILDNEEAVLAAPGLEALVDRHERVIASIDRLTQAVIAAAKRE